MKSNIVEDILANLRNSDNFYDSNHAYALMDEQTKAEPSYLLVKLCDLELSPDLVSGSILETEAVDECFEESTTLSPSDTWVWMLVKAAREWRGALIGEITLYATTAATTSSLAAVSNDLYLKATLSSCSTITTLRQ